MENAGWLFVLQNRAVGLQPKDLNMCPGMSRRGFLTSTAVGLASCSNLAAWAAPSNGGAELSQLVPQPRVRVGKVYLGNPHPGWPMASVDVEAERQRFEVELQKLDVGLRDVEFVDAGWVRTEQELAAAKEKFKAADGILAIHLTMGIGGQLQSLMELKIPLVLFTLPYSGHEWHTIASWQRQGKLIEVFPTSRHADVLVALRPFRALRRLKEAKVLHVNFTEADPAYVKALREKFGTRIISLRFEDLQKAYQNADAREAETDARRWIRDAKKVLEPTREEIVKSSTMFVAMRNLLAEHQAVAITMNCLGMGLIDRGMGYPCLGFVRFNNCGLGGICEADLKSTMTHLIFSGLVGRPGFVTDPVFDLSNSTIIHAHCVAATQMEGPEQRPSPYVIRSHLEDNKGAALQVRLPTGKKISMARLIGTDLMLFSTGEAVDSPFVDRACRTKLTTRVEHIERFLENWSCGLHRVVFYGDHTADIRRFCRFAQIRFLQEGIDDLQQVPGLEWQPHVHA